MAGVCVALTDMLDVPGTVEEGGQAEGRSSWVQQLASQRLKEIPGPRLTLHGTDNAAVTVVPSEAISTCNANKLAGFIISVVAATETPMHGEQKYQALRQEFSTWKSKLKEKKKVFQIRLCKDKWYQFVLHLNSSLSNYNKTEILAVWAVRPWRRLPSAQKPFILFFFHKNIVFPAQAEYSYFSADFRLKIFLWISLDYSVWHFWFRRNAFGVSMVLKKVQVILEPAYRH